VKVKLIFGTTYTLLITQIQNSENNLINIHIANQIIDYFSADQSTVAVVVLAHFSHHDVVAIHHIVVHRLSSLVVHVQRSVVVAQADVSQQYDAAVVDAHSIVYHCARASVLPLDDYDCYCCVPSYAKDDHHFVYHVNDVLAIPMLYK
jgi:hypothetical protein